MNVDYCIDYEDLTELTVNEVLVLLSKIHGLLASEMKVRDLVFYKNNPIYPGNGVYIFKDDSRYIYVGDCVARNFVERVPAHFDPRHFGWFNSLLKNLSKEKNIENDDIESVFIENSRFAFDNFSIILINFKNYDRKHINKLETLLRIVLKPLNTFKHKKFEKLDSVLKQVIED